MTNDSGQRQPDSPTPDFSMPRILDIQIRPTTFEAPRLRNFTSSLPSSQDAVEFIVTTDGPIPGRALGPTLRVGNTPVTEVTPAGPNTYRFVAPTRQGFEVGAPIRLAWSGLRPDEADDSVFRYRL